MIPTLRISPRFGEILVDEAKRTRYLPSLISFELTGEHLEQWKGCLDKGSDRYVSLHLKQEHKNSHWNYSVTQNGKEVKADHLNSFIQMVEQAPLSTKTKELCLDHLRSYARSKTSR